MGITARLPAHRCHSPLEVATLAALAGNHPTIGAGERRGGATAAAWLLAATSTLLTVAGLALYGATRTAPAPVGYAIRGFEAIVAIPLTISGFVLMRRRADKRHRLVSTPPPGCSSLSTCSPTGTPSPQ